MTYSFDYERPIYTADQLRTATPLKPNEPLQREMTQIPQQDVPQVEAVLHDKSTQGNTEYDRESGLYKWFNSPHGFAYSLSTKPGTTVTEIGPSLVNKAGD